MRFARRVVMVLLSLFCGLGLNTGHASDGGIYTDLLDFAGTNGSIPDAALTLYDGVFYGTASQGGPFPGSFGVIFSFDPLSSTYTVLYNFNGTLGNSPSTMLILSDGVFYGTTEFGGINNQGVIFSFDPSSSAYTVVHNFGGSGGALPVFSLTLYGGIFYGTALGGGMHGAGVIFSFDPASSTYTKLYDFDVSHGAFPEDAMTLNGGIFYGTAPNGGMILDNGVIYSFDPSNSTYTDVHNFSGADGSFPAAALTLYGGVFYGTTTYGGTSDNGVIFSFDPSSSTYTVLYNFDGTQGANSFASLILSDGVFYGTASAGGAIPGDNGVIFSFDPSSSTYTVLHNFSGADGSSAEAALTLNGGVLYGTAALGGANSFGVIFSFAPLVPPSNLTGRQKKNDCGAKYEWFNDLKWPPPTLGGGQVAGYNIYRNGAKIAALPASALHFRDHNRKKGVKALYSVTTINIQGNESSSVNITVP